MKNGMNLMQLAQELTRIQESAKDYIVPTELMRAENIGGKLTLGFTNGQKNNYALNNHSTGQLAQYADIPKAYLDRVAIENPDLAASNINHGLEKQARIAREAGKREARLVRSIDGRVRGFLSSKYRILDAHDLLEAVLPSMLDAGMEVVSSNVSDTRMYIKALLPRIQGEVKKGDIVQYGLAVSTSDVGAGRVQVSPFFNRLACLNGLIMESAIKKNHVGRSVAEDDVRELLSDRTKELSDAAFWGSVRDTVIASMRPENFQRELEILRAAAGEKIEKTDLEKVVEVAMKQVGVAGEKKKSSILAALMSGNEGAGLTKWGLVNSFTRAAQDDAFDYEESTELERAGGQVLTLSKSQWALVSA